MPQPGNASMGQLVNTTGAKKFEISNAKMHYALTIGATATCPVGLPSGILSISSKNSCIFWSFFTNFGSADKKNEKI